MENQTSAFQIEASDADGDTITYSVGGEDQEFFNVSTSLQTLKSIPEFELSIDVTPQFINKFIAGKGALGETDNFTIINDGGNVKVVIGHSSVNTNRVTIPVNTTKVSDIDNVSFNANIFKEVLSANKECQKVVKNVLKFAIYCIFMVYKT